MSNRRHGNVVVYDRLSVFEPYIFKSMSISVSLFRFRLISKPPGVLTRQIPSFDTQDLHLTDNSELSLADWRFEAGLNTVVPMSG